MTSGVDDAFRASSAIVVAELEPDTRRYVLELLAMHGTVKVVREGTHRRIARVRILSPGGADDVSEDAELGTQRSGIEKHRELINIARLSEQEIENRTKQLLIHGLDCAPFPRFCVLANELGSPAEAPRVRPLAWLMRLIEDIYELRCCESSFPLVTVNAIRGHYGLDQIAAARCWDVVYTVLATRARRVEVELFARFLQQTYNANDFSMLLRARAAITTVCGCGSNFLRSRWSSSEPPVFLLARKQCLAVCAQLASRDTPAYRTLAQATLTHVHGDDGLDFAYLLHLIVIVHHEGRTPTAQITSAECI